MIATDTEAPTGEGDASPGSMRSRPGPWAIPLTVIMIGFVVFWVWALFFASKEAVNKIDDREWAERAEGICAAAEEDREALIDTREIDTGDAAQLAERAGIVDQATDIVENMLDDVVADSPTDAKGAELVPQWEADYRTLIENRREFADRLRDGRNEPFTEAAVDGIPISEKLEQFAGDNDMPSCAPPQDLAN